MDYNNDLRARFIAAKVCTGMTVQQASQQWANAKQLKPLVTRTESQRRHFDKLLSRLGF